MQFNQFVLKDTNTPTATWTFEEMQFNQFVLKDKISK